MPHRPAKPALNRGRLQIAARRLFLLSDVVATSDVTAAGYPQKQRLMPHDYKAARRALARIAVPVGYGGGSGRPMLWRLRNSGEKLEV